MPCEELENRVQDLLDQRLSPRADETVCAHVGECVECRTWLDGLEQALAATATLECPPAPCDMRQRVLTALGPSSPAPPRDQHWVRTLLALAAALLVLATVGVSIRAFLERPAGHEVVPVVQQPAAPVQPPADGSDVLAAVIAVPSREPVDELAHDARLSLATALVIVPNLPGRDIVIEEDAPGTTSGVDAWEREVQAELAPLTRSATGALESLWLTLPGVSQETRS